MNCSNISRRQLIHHDLGKLHEGEISGKETSIMAWLAKGMAINPWSPKGHFKWCEALVWCVSVCPFGPRSYFYGFNLRRAYLVSQQTHNIARYWLLLSCDDIALTMHQHRYQPWAKVASTTSIGPQNKVLSGHWNVICYPVLRKLTHNACPGVMSCYSSTFWMKFFFKWCLFSNLQNHTTSKV